MRDFLIDTNIYSYALKGDPETVLTLKKARRIGISSVSIGELLSGFKGGKKEKENTRELAEFLDSPRVRLYPVDENTAEFYAEIIYELRKNGTPIPTNDIWIASVAFQCGLPLFSKDRHFREVKGLVLIS